MNSDLFPHNSEGKKRFLKIMRKKIPEALLLYMLIYSNHYGHEYWLDAKRTTSQMEASKMSFQVRIGEWSCGAFVWNGGHQAVLGILPLELFWESSSGNRSHEAELDEGIILCVPFGLGTPWMGYDWNTQLLIMDGWTFKSINTLMKLLYVRSSA